MPHFDRIQGDSHKAVDYRYRRLTASTVSPLSVASVSNITCYVTDCQCHSKECLRLLMTVPQSDSSVTSITCQLAFSLCSHTNALGSNTTLHGVKPAEYAFRCMNKSSAVSCQTHLRVVTHDKKYLYSGIKSIKSDNKRRLIRINKV